MANLSNELGISKNRKIEILLEMGYKHLWGDLKEDDVEYAYHNPKKTGTSHWIKSHDIDSFFASDRIFIDFVNYKLNK